MENENLPIISTEETSFLGQRRIKPVRKYGVDKRKSNNKIHVEMYSCT